MTSKKILAIAIIFAGLCCSTLYRVVRYHDMDNATANEKQERESATLAMLNVLKDRKQTVDVAATLSPPRRLNVDKDFTTENNSSRVTTPAPHSKIKHAPPSSTPVKICVCALTRSKPTWKTLDDSRVMKNVIASTHRTTAMEWDKFEVQILLGADADDAFWQRHADALKRQAVDQYAMQVTFKFYQKHDNFLPFNDLMRDGYHTGSEYLVRINDDTEFTSNGWLSLGVGTLRSFQPPNVGVVGPSCAQGNTKILTHDMVHRTHLDIFKTYYPVVFHNWYLDDWISWVYGPARTKKIQSWTVVHHVEQQGQRYKEVMSDEQSLQHEINTGNKLIRTYLAAAQNEADERSHTKDNHTVGNRSMQEYLATTISQTVVKNNDVIISAPQNRFQIHVLTMNRVESLKRLLKSIQDAEYGSHEVNLIIHVDYHAKNQACIVAAQEFQFSHGSTKIDIAWKNRGLRDSWFNAWRPKGAMAEYALILEDDIELSRDWYQWLAAAWNTYGNRGDLAGISLQRQAFVHKKGHEQIEIINNHLPFLYASVGSIGFSPHWKQWHDFLQWIDKVDVSTVDIRTPDLVTSDWFYKSDKRQMWTQYFIWFCQRNALFTLFVNLPDRKTLASHMREPGEHTARDMQRDFFVAHRVGEMQFPKTLSKYGWDAKLIPEEKMIQDGSTYGGWTYDASGLNSDSIVYSVGLGEDTSWDEGIMERFGLKVWGFDPTPKSIEYIKKNSRLNKTKFLLTPEGLGTKQGVMEFTKPKNPNFVSMRQGVHDDGGEVIKVAINKLENWMRRFHHSKIDILKLDIEGSEYNVLENWISTKWFPMTQMLVEFHHRFLKDDKQHQRVLRGLLLNGFKIINNNNNQEISFKRSLANQDTDAVRHVPVHSEILSDKTLDAAIVVMFNGKYQSCGVRLIQSIRTVGKWNGAIVAILPVEYDVDLSKFDVTKLKRPPFTTWTYRESSSVYNKFYMFTDPYFRQFQTLMFLDADGQVQDSVVPLFDLFSKTNSTLIMRDNGVGIGKSTLFDNEFASKRVHGLKNTQNPGGSCLFLLNIKRLPPPKEMESRVTNALTKYASIVTHGDQGILHVLFRDEYSVFAPCLPIKIVDVNAIATNGWYRKHCLKKKEIYIHDYRKHCLADISHKTNRLPRSDFKHLNYDPKKLAHNECPAFSSQREINTEPYSNLLVLAEQIQHNYGFVNIQILNEGYVEMTKSWTCNVQNFEGVLKSTLFVTTDATSFKQLREFRATLNIVCITYHTPPNMSYGQYVYYDYMLFRSNIINMLLQEKITVWLTESDATWLSNPIDTILKTNADFVTMSDVSPPGKMLQGGFLFLRPTTATMSTWQKMRDTLEHKMQNTKVGTEMGDSGSEQLILNKIIHAEPGLKIHWLDDSMFAPGKYYSDKTHYKNPIVILNNWIVGNDAKKKRAQRWGHWYLSEDGRCKNRT